VNKAGLCTVQVGGRAWLATPTGCRLAAPPLSSPSSTWSEEMYESKFMEVINYIMGCSCFSRGDPAPFKI
jgi:hypothetical protein